MNVKHWFLPYSLLELSVQIMRSHGARGHEGLALWFGIGDETTVEVTHVIEPAGPGFRTAPLHMSLSLRALAALTDLADRHHVFLIGQVHSHPGRFLDLSDLDEEQGFRIPGYLSLVCPYYAQRQLGGLAGCGVHVYEGGHYRRLSDIEIKQRLTLREASLTHLRCGAPL